MNIFIVFHFFTCIVFTILSYENMNPKFENVKISPFYDLVQFAIFYVGFSFLSHFITKKLKNKFSNIQWKSILIPCIIEYVVKISSIFYFPTLGETFWYGLLAFILLNNHIILDFLTKKTGLNELYFILIVFPVFQSILILLIYSDFSIQSILGFGPFSLQLLPILLTHNADFKNIEYNTNTPEYNSLTYESKYSFSRLLGKQDSFRVISVIFIYNTFEIIYDYSYYGKHLFLAIEFILISIYAIVCKKYSENDLEKSFRINVINYFMFSVGMIYVQFN